jgi:hypothetical protein
VEALVLILIVLLLLLWLVLAVLLTGWSMWFQAAIYTESSTGLVWRGPAAASALMLVVLVWVFLAYRAPGKFRPLWETASTEQKRFDELRVPLPGGRDEVYKRRPGGEYRLGGQPKGKVLPSTPPEVVVIEDGERYTFEPDRDEHGNFKRRKVPGGSSTEPLRYRDDKGRVMEEGSLGLIQSFRAGVLFGNVLLNLAFLASAFLGFWLLLRFQWAHALGQAVVLSLLLLLFVMPQMLSQIEAVAQQRAAASRSS